MAEAGGGQIIVTGASRGIGAAIARELDRRGHAVVGLSRGGDSAAGIGLACDVTDEASIARVVLEIAARGPIAALVNNAGAYEEHASATLSAAGLERTLRLNTVAPFVAAREVYPHMKSAGGGLIVNIGSFYEKLGVARSLAYCASKAAIGAMTRCLATEWAGDKIRVLCVAPGFVETDLNREFLSSDKMRTWLSRRVPVGRAATPDEIARLVAMLCGEDIGYLTGETIFVDGGHGMQQ